VLRRKKTRCNLETRTQTLPTPRQAPYHSVTHFDVRQSQTSVSIASLGGPATGTLVAGTSCCHRACAASSASQERDTVRPHVFEHGQCNGHPGSLWGATLSTPQFPPTGHQNEASLSKKEHCLFGTRFRLTWQHTLFLRAHQRWGGHPHNLICRKSSEFLLSVGAYSWWDCLTHC
jgi:hypothetical protein